ncbi:hypothetical protein KY495_20350 [Massilia sp. PAMC28688]|uniref:hypothetical protein n=1 Tax=Massilia sp. PAMC28688 TaxID=2861283 RepID=UPI001C625255|nr:hypothetical protein [Massilia sp. PAMC28688]QYF93027.1 hypothetical protein KY495_20350 [Massilia sp. PAMC28688]
MSQFGPYELSLMPSWVLWSIMISFIVVPLVVVFVHLRLSANDESHGLSKNSEDPGMELVTEPQQEPDTQRKAFVAFYAVCILAGLAILITKFDSLSERPPATLQLVSLVIGLVGCSRVVYLLSRQ